MKKLVFMVLMISGSFAFASDCFTLSLVRHWKATGRNHLQVQTGSSRLYDVEVFSCTRLQWAETIGFRTFPSGMQRVCKGDDVVVFDMTGRYVEDVCPIRNITRVDSSTQASL